MSDDRNPSAVSLRGGNINPGVVRLGGEVHRAAGPYSAFTARLLTFLESAGFACSPRYLGTDDQGRDVLSHIDGTTTRHPSERAPGAYGCGGRMLRALHDVTAGTVLAGDEECVAHGDPGPFNAIFRHGIPVAFIDWDQAHPGARLPDLAYMAWTWCIQAVGGVPIEAQARHLRELRDGYGAVAGDALVSAILTVQTGLIERESRRATDPETPDRRNAHARRAVEWAQADHDLTLRHRADLLAGLE